MACASTPELRLSIHRPDRRVEPFVLQTSNREVTSDAERHILANLSHVVADELS